MKKFIFTILILFIIPICTLRCAEASAEAGATPTMLLENAPTSVDGQQQFYVDVAVDPQGVSLNGIQGTVTFSDDTLSFVRAETGSSILSYFVDQPTVSGNTINFSGIIIGGFDGLINPFDQSHKLPGEIMRLVFEGTSPGSATIASSKVTIALNDGQGTLQKVADAAATFTVSSTVTPSVYNTPDTIPPTITASVTQDPNLFDNKFALIFSAVDKQSGIDHVELKEGNDSWITIQSPYLLHDQSRKSILSLRAYDVAGNVSSVTIVPPAYSQFGGTVIFIVLLLFLIALYVIYRKHKHHKKTV